MTNPVVAADGHTYEDTEIRRYLSVSPYSPMTRQYMDSSSLRHNYALKSQIDRYHATNPVIVSKPIKPFRSEAVEITAISCVYDRTDCVNIIMTPPAKGTRQPIVMIIALDNSGSMGENASTAEMGSTAFTRMDLCKHTIRTVAGMLGEEDMLSIVTFSTAARTVLRPTHMDEDGKTRMEVALKTVQPDSQTNIWAGLEMVNRIAASPKLADTHRVAVLLTDGLPNVNPPRGIVETYKAAVKSCLLSTFGFGYNLDSKLLYDLATVGGGSFGFIPDYSMVATVFINWVATALATAAILSSLTLVHDDGTHTNLRNITLQYGQPRSILYNKASKTFVVNNYSKNTVPGVLSSVDTVRNDIIRAIQACVVSDGTTNLFRVIYEHYKTSTDESVIALLRDINPNIGDEEGQIHMAPRFYQKWGKHYMRAYLKAQELQQCMNFKDHGLQLYGGELFHTIQSEGEAVFTSLPGLEPTGSAFVETAAATAATAPPVNMAQFYNPQGGCFGGKSLVRMADGSRRTIVSLNRGDLVWTPFGVSGVRALVTCTMKEPIRAMCHIGELTITPWHPIQMNNAWVFPCDITPIEPAELHTVYNIVLYKGHILDVNDTLCVTLGHQYTEPVVSHPFFGTERVIKDLTLCKGWVDGKPFYNNLQARRNPVTNIIEEWYDAE